MCCNSLYITIVFGSRETGGKIERLDSCTREGGEGGKRMDDF